MSCDWLFLHKKVFFFIYSYGLLRYVWHVGWENEERNLEKQRSCFCSNLLSIRTLPQNIKIHPKNINLEREYTKKGQFIPQITLRCFVLICSLTLPAKIFGSHIGNYSWFEPRPFRWFVLIFFLFFFIKWENIYETNILFFLDRKLVF